MLSKAEQIIGHFNRDRIKQILPEIERQAQAKKDFVAPAHKLAMGADGRLRLGDIQSFKLEKSGNTFMDFAEAESAAEPGERIIVQKEHGNFPLRNRAEQQLCSRLNVPLDFVKRLRNDGQEHLAASILSDRLTLPRRGIDYPEDEQPGDALNSDRLMVRMLDNQVRAVVSDRYRIIDNVDLFYCAAQAMKAAGADIWQMRLSDDRFEMLAVTRGIFGQVSTDRTFDPGDGWESRWANLGGDTQYAAMSITNSETGGGSVNVAPSVLRRVCANFCVWGNVVRSVHIGRKRDEEGLITSPDIQAQESRLVWAKVAKAIETCFNPQKFQEYIDIQNGATRRNIAAEKVTETTAAVMGKFEISAERKDAILANLLGSHDLTQYGMVQALTATAHGLDEAGQEDEAAALELAGGELMLAGENEWRGLTAAV